MNREILSSFPSFRMLLASLTSGMRPSHLGVQSDRRCVLANFWGVRAG